jgi:L-ascorbate metabolism protein UlaG (beta-lactamase superfamily)
MKLTYIFHSGFAIESDETAVIIDYWHDSANIVPAILSSKKHVYVLSSHFHQDHFNPSVLSWRNTRQDIRYILSKDILRHKLAKKEDALFLVKGLHYEDENIYIEAFGSTDIGVSWHIKIEDKSIFHAGDLNNWLWLDESPKEDSERMQKMYLGELKDIKKKVSSFDVAMFPVDSRIGRDYMRGAKQFIETFNVKLFVPMHFTANPLSDAMAIEPYTESKGINLFRIKKDGDSIIIP